ncbi:MAG: Bax inhibitor-1/YccA family protein [Mycoplasmatales bacterium]
MKSTNPFLKEQAVSYASSGATFNAKGALNKTILGLVVMVGIMLITISTPLIRIVASMYIPLSIGLFVAMIALGIMARNDISKAKMIFWVYAIIEGLLLSVFVAIAESIIPGIGITAALITFGIVVGMYLVYQIAPGLIRTLTPIFIVAIGVLGLLFFVNFIVSIFGAGFLPYDSMGFSLLLLGISSFSIGMDFQQIDMMDRANLSKEYEWLGALGLLTSIVWTFINVIRLLLIRGRD